MIESIKIVGVATYGNEPSELSGLSSVNFVFGSNGTGKTTISRLIANAAAYPSCALGWKDGVALQTLVYNRDFVDKNFHQSPELKGVFTLGEKQVEVLAKIEKAKGEHDEISKKIQVLTQTLQAGDGNGGKRGEMETLEAELKAECWSVKTKYDDSFSVAFEGFRGSSEKFKKKVLSESSSNKAELRPLADLEKKAAAVFQQTPLKESKVVIPDASRLLSHESNPILKKRVVGKDDVDIAAIIKKLGNSDWVQEGRVFYEATNGVCPFCQQETEPRFAKSLAEYFDDTFTTDSNAIRELEAAYSTDAARLQQQLAALIGTPSRFLETEKLTVEKELLDAKVTVNKQRLSEKKKEASRQVELESIAGVVASIETILQFANAAIDAHNKMVDNLADERRQLSGEVWRFVLEELKQNLDNYKTRKEKLEKAISSITTQIEDAKRELRQKASEIRSLEKQTTSIQPTIDGINGLLSMFGFQGFKLAKSEAGNYYKIVRPDGSDAKETLSEGERTFVTFLYFYHLLKGSDSDSGVTTDRVVVFDDPVSSLDSDVLFVVSSMIKGLFEDIRGKTGQIKQIFVLTHNVYFHKEVSFNARRSGKALNDETFWVVRKAGLISKVEKHESNPIKTSYELLWAEVRRKDISSLTIQNTLRRILENYFKIFGGVDPDSLCSKFEAKERVICKSMLSWVNDGSHFAHDDVYVSLDESMVETYLSVFRKIFERSGHLAHYEMMMGDSFAEKKLPTPVKEAAA